MNDILNQIKELSKNKQVKVAFTGTHGTGKTSGVFKLAYDLKMLINNKTIHTLMENAKESPYKINKQTSEQSQLWIFSNQMSKEMELQAKYDILICDRTIVDAVSYSKTMNFDNMVSSMKDFCKYYINTYDMILFRHTKNNPYHFSDGNRDADDNIYRLNMEENLLSLYEDIGVKDKLIII